MIFEETPHIYKKVKGENVFINQKYQNKHLQKR